MTTQARVVMRYRAKPSESIAERHRFIFGGLSQLEEPWGCPAKNIPKVPDIGADLEVMVNLAPLLGDGLRGGIGYLLRSDDYLRDSGQSDDKMIVEFDLDTQLYFDLQNKIFAKYINIFCPYRAAVFTDRSLVIDDQRQLVAQARESGEEPNGRNSVWRIWPLSYFDRLLCQRAWNLSPEEIVTTLRGEIDEVEIVGDGVLICISKELLDREQIEMESQRVADLLNSASV